MGPPNIACIGECMLEFVSSRTQHSTFERRYGGDTLNTCVYLARLLKTSAKLHYVTRLGADRFSQSMIEDWQRQDIDCSMVERVPGRLPGLYIIDTDDTGERSFMYWRSEAPARELFRASGQEIAGRLAGFAVLYLSGITLAILSPEGRARVIDLMTSCRNGGGLVAYDTNHRSRLWNDPADAVLWNSRAIGASTLVLPSSDDLSTLFGEALTNERWLDRLSHLGATEAVLKTGGDTVHILQDGNHLCVPLARIPAPLDTTGAGDSFNAGYLAARLDGATPTAAVASGHRLASAVVMRPGAIIPESAMPDMLGSSAAPKSQVP
jgi:2-dehydro-3-deoxygluconokinase